MRPVRILEDRPGLELMAAVAQSVEQRLVVPRAAGSIPVGRPSFTSDVKGV